MKTSQPHRTHRRRAQRRQHRDDKLSNCCDSLEQKPPNRLWLWGALALNKQKVRWPTPTSSKRRKCHCLPLFPLCGWRLPPPLGAPVHLYFASRMVSLLLPRVRWAFASPTLGAPVHVYLASRSASLLLPYWWLSGCLPHSRCTCAFVSCFPYCFPIASLAPQVAHQSP